MGGLGPYKYAYKTEANIMGNNHWIEHFRVRLKHGVPLQSRYIVTPGPEGTSADSPLEVCVRCTMVQREVRVNKIQDS